MGKRTLPAAYHTPAPLHPLLRLSSPVPSAASNDYTLPVLDADELVDLDYDDLKNLWSDRYEYDVPLETKHEFLRRFGIVPELLPAGRVDEIFNAWDPDDPPPGKAFDPEHEIINDDDYAADAYFYHADHPNLEPGKPVLWGTATADPESGLDGPSLLKLDNYNHVLQAVDNDVDDGDADAEGEPEATPDPYNPYADKLGKGPQHFKPP